MVEQALQEGGGRGLTWLVPHRCGDPPCMLPAAVLGLPEAQTLPRALPVEPAALGSGAGGLAGIPGAVLIPRLTGDTWSIGVDFSSGAACSPKSLHQP